MLCAMRSAMAFLGLLAAAAALAGGAVTYRWVDADGIHYSDQPHPGAEQITLSTPQTYSSAAAAPSAAARGRARDSGQGGNEAVAFRYDSCDIIQPAQDQMLINPDSASVAVRITPGKRSTDRVVLSFDGQTVEPQNDDQVEFIFKPIERGTHTVTATVRSADGKDMCVSSALTFHVRQPDVNKPFRRPTPH